MTPIARPVIMDLKVNTSSMKQILRNNQGDNYESSIKNITNNKNSAGYPISLPQLNWSFWNIFPN